VSVAGSWVKAQMVDGPSSIQLYQYQLDFQKSKDKENRKTDRRRNQEIDIASVGRSPRGYVAWIWARMNAVLFLRRQQWDETGEHSRILRAECYLRS
jgi:hypothetical protein